MSGRDDLSATLAALREAFDASFAAAPPGDRPEEVALLAIRVGGEPAALRVHDTLGLMKAGPIVAVPSRRRELLGITGVRGAVVPVYSLARLTGREEGEAPRWIVLAGAAERVGLAFASFDGHVRVPAAAISAQPGQEPGASSAVVELDSTTRPVLDVPAIVRAITEVAVGRTE